MERESLVLAAVEALAREGIENADETFDLSQVDLIIRWVALRAVENASKRTIPDEKVAAAVFLSDLINAAFE